MDHLIGQRFNLISKSEIRYVGTLHEINPEASTIALEDVYSFGTEDRKVEKFIPPSQQKFQFIVFRGSDVKDIKIAEDEPSEPAPPANIPNDPAILNSRTGPPHPGPPHDSRFGPGPYPPPGGFGPGFYPPGQFGRGNFGPPPGGFGPGPGFGPYGPPPPGYFGPPGHGFPQGPGPFSLQQPPIGPPGQRNEAHQPPPPQPSQPSQPRAPGPAPTSELPDNKAPASTGPSVPPASAPGPSAEGPKSTPTDTLPKSTPPTSAAATSSAAPPKQIPTGPKNNRVTPAVPFAVNQKSFTPPVPVAADAAQSANGTTTGKQPTKPITSQAAMDEAARQAKEAVAAAMAKLNPQAAQPKPAPTAASIDALTKKVGEMNTTQNGTQRGRGTFRGTRASYPRSGSGGHAPKKMEIPKSDFDFESANAKFSKEDLIKDAIASGSPLEETAPEEIQGAEPAAKTPARKDSLNSAPAYNKATSFFDNISSEAKDREDGNDTRTQARQARGEEFKKNLETFGQGNVDGGYRGRGRGGYGRGRQYGGNYRGGYRNNNYRGNRGRAGPGQTAGDQAAAQ